MNYKIPVNLSNYPKESLQKFFDDFDVIFTDCDGVLIKENSVIDSSNLLINKFLENGKKVFMVSNNNQTTRDDLLKKCQNLNFNFTIDNIFTSSSITGMYLKSLNFNKKAYVIGSEELGEELTKFGIEHIGIGRDDMSDTYGEYMMNNYKLYEDVGAVIVGLDKFFNIPKMLKAMNYLKNPEILFLATNVDVRSEFPNLIFPDAGPIVASIEKASYRKATVIGKPSSILFDLLKLKSDKERILMIGDRLSVDIAFGKNSGIKTMLVETGDDKMENVGEILRKIEENEENLIPDYVVKSLGLFL
ncbi:hypothetical protein PVAND_017465 [Polypedilum vanderplanki]|uniref:4-nitrophenylphosphatase n=1 Tax=Polypedilum vanderplanki TaxID=319348 RepID=A0A9J6BIN5_POLVA|nr:hypothetical protein PVAND_017465 [Polypedilum vanderplanki]